MPLELSGRERELTAVDAFLERSKTRLSVLTLTGPPGIGKTVVWREALRRAGLCHYLVLSARPSEAERRLSFAGLSDLLRLMDPEAFGSLVPVQHHAIDVALMRAEADAHVFQQGAIPAAVLSLLESAAAARPDPPPYILPEEPVSLALGRLRVTPHMAIGSLTLVAALIVVISGLAGLFIYPSLHPKTINDYPDLKPPAQQRVQPDGGKNFLGTNHRLRTECRIVIDDQAIEIEAGSGQNMKMHIIDCDPAPKRGPD